MIPIQIIRQPESKRAIAAPLQDVGGGDGPRVNGDGRVVEPDVPWGGLA